MPGYSLTGRFFELCDCYTICPCWVDESPTDDRCTGAFGWLLESGSIGGVDVAGRSVVSVSFHTGHRDSGGQEVFLFVDEGASDEQFDALVTTFSGRNGGPLGELGALMGRSLGEKRAPIRLTTSGDHIAVTVGRVVSGDATVMRGPDGGPTELSHGRLSRVLGTPAEVAKSSTLRIDLGGVGLSVEVTGRAAMRGAFEYVSEGTTVGN